MYLAILSLPLVGAIISGLLYLICIYSSSRGAKYFNLIGWLSSTSTIVITFILSIIILQNVLSYNEVYKIPLFNWLVIERIYIFWELSFNILTCIMIFLVSLISSCVFFYSLGYIGIQKHEKLAKFMFYLGCFSFFMLFLILSNDLLQMFIGWEGVSLFSYFLISFLYENKTASIAANKAFIINRIADCGFLIGILLTLQTFGTLNIENIFNQLSAFQDYYIKLGSYETKVLYIIAFLFTVAAMGKSAQLFFQVWLPDAMEAPTPVSALLHAATMVTAGIFLLVRLSPIISSVADILIFIKIIGAITAFLGATIAIVSTNLKKIIAYSTISQLGYMFIAVGADFFNGAMFHVITHAFFKGCLFLCAGIIIHRLNGEQDIYKMGALYKKMPIVYIASWISILALCGIPPFSGFYSKEAILNQVTNFNSYVDTFIYILSLITVVFTAFYSFKLLILVFHGKPQYKDYDKHTSITMTISIIVLAILSIIGGVLHKTIIGKGSTQFWNNIIVNNTVNVNHNVFEYFPIILTLVGIFSAYLIYIKRREMLTNITRTFSGTYKFLFNKWYFDKLYDYLIISNFYRVSKTLMLIENKVLNPIMVNLIMRVFYRFSVFFNRIQTGYFYHYILIMLLGILVLLFIILWGN